MLILDCSSRTQALHTLSAGFGCSPEKLKKVLLSLDLESIYELNPRQLGGGPDVCCHTGGMVVPRWHQRCLYVRNCRLRHGRAHDKRADR